ncbi:MAG: BMC domain-containing protein [Candidatus Eiseniibacteriota bacterium]|jgi:microcompartment protein CcmL/EutN
MIETRGWVALVEAADAMAKAAPVELQRWANVDAGLVTILARGDVGAVEAAVEAGVRAAKRVGAVVTSHVIPMPYPPVDEAVLSK